MKLTYKLTIAFIFFIFILGVTSIISTSFILDQRMQRDLETSEVMFAQSLAKTFFKSVVDKNSLAMTDTLFDEKKLREEKIEYIIIYDNNGYLLAHTYLSIIPKRISSFKHDFGENQYHVEKIKDNELYVYDVSVPVMEGINQVGTVHVGYRGKYLESIKKDLVNTSIVFTTLIGIMAALISLVLSKRIVGPIKKLRDVADEVTNGNFDAKLPEANTKDEISDLIASMEMMLIGFKVMKEKMAKPLKTLANDVSSRKKAKKGGKNV